MNCDLKCDSCAYAAYETAAGKVIVVDVVGTLPDTALLDFSGSPVVTIGHRGYSIRFINFAGEDRHIGRKILASHPDVVLDMVDSMDLEHSLRLPVRFIDMDSKLVLALSRYDELLATGHSLDYDTLGNLMGFPVTPLHDSSEETLSRLLSLIVDTYENPLDHKKHVHVPYGTDIEEALARLTPLINDSGELACEFHDRYLALRLLEDPQYIFPRIQNAPNAKVILLKAAQESFALEREYGEKVTDLTLKARRGFVSGALQETLRHSDDSSDHTILQKIDAVLTSRFLGFPILALVLLGVFQATFSLGAYPQEWIEDGISLLAVALRGVMSPGWFSSMLIDGIVQGVGAVLAFLPNIVILFFFLSILEDSGYMARAAFLMDKLMHRIGLHGKSFIPMLIGFGCNVPAIMAARTIEDRRDRALTMLMIPFMSCSARLPVYLLFVSAFFVGYKALVMIGIYLAGIALSILFAYIMKHTRWFRKPNDDYVSELPPFRMPTLRNTGAHIWERVSDYLQKISTVILAASVIIWALEYFPSDRTNGGTNKEESYLAMVGHSIEPVMKPLGFDWKMNVCLITGLPAKEAIVSTMGILYHSEDDESTAEAMRTESGVTPPVALGFMLFVLLYFPCIATIATLKREIGSRWAIFSVINSLVLAWVVSFIVFQIGTLLM